MSSDLENSIVGFLKDSKMKQEEKKKTLVIQEKNKTEEASARTRKPVLEANKVDDEEEEIENIGEFFQKKKNIDDLKKDRVGSAGAKSKKNKSSPSRPYNFNKLSDKEKEEYFLNIYDQNIQMNKKREVLEKELKILQAKFNKVNTDFTHLKPTLYDEKKEKENTDAQDFQKTELFKIMEENIRLKEKLTALATAKNIVSKPPSLKKTTKKAITTTMDSTSAKKIQELCELIDKLKQRLKESETENRALQEQMNRSTVVKNQGQNSRELLAQNQKLGSLQTRFDGLQTQMMVQQSELTATKERLNQAYKDLKDERDRFIVLEKQVKLYEISARNAEDIQRNLEERNEEYKRLKERMDDLLRLPIHQNRKTDFNHQEELSKKEFELTKIVREFSELKAEKRRLDVDNDGFQKQIKSLKEELEEKTKLYIEYKTRLEVKETQIGPFKEIEADTDNFLRTLGALRWKGEEPAWLKLDFIDRPYLDTKDPNSLLKEIERLKLEKGELAAQLEKSQTLLRTHMEIEEENRKINQADITKMELQLKAALNRAEELSKIVDLKGLAQKDGVQVYERQGVRYDDSVSVFSTDTNIDDIGAGQNYLDLWIGQVQYDEPAVGSFLTHKQSKLRDPKKLLSFLTVDFYNHDTLHSSIAEGLDSNFNFQVGFKVVCDDFFIKYLETGFMKFEIYFSESMDAIKMGDCSISLKDLFIKNKMTGVSGVLKSTVSIHSEKGDIIGIINLKMRMRLPISETIRWLREKRDIGIDEEDYDAVMPARKRRLVVLIDRATGFWNKANSFVFYNIGGSDYFTTTQPGSNPRWDYHAVHNINYNEEFIAFLRNNCLEFTVFDDSIPLTGTQNMLQELTDVVGVAKVSIAGLLHNEIIDCNIEVIGPKSEKKGHLNLKVFWHEGSMPVKPTPEDALITQSWVQEMTIRIGNALRQKRIDRIDQVFNLFDRDRDRIVSDLDMEHAIIGTLNLQILKEHIKLYYDYLVPKPLNERNFEIIFAPYIGKPQPVPNMIGNNLRGELSNINSYINRNTNQLPYREGGENWNKEILERFRLRLQHIFSKQLEKKSEMQLFSELDKNGNGLISASEMSSFFKRTGNSNITEMELFEFFQQLDRNFDGNIDIREFLDFTLSVVAFRKEALFRMDTNIEIDDTETNLQMAQELTLRRVFDSIFLYMEKKKKKYLDVYEVIDKNKDNLIKKPELDAFLKDSGTHLSQGDINFVFKYMDRDGNGSIDVKEFMDLMKKRALNLNMDDPGFRTPVGRTFSRKFEQPIIDRAGISRSGTQEELFVEEDEITQAIMEYSAKKNMSLKELFDEIDSGASANGYITVEELKRFLSQKVKIQVPESQIKQFFNLIDKTKDKRISILEFTERFKPVMERSPAHKRKSLISRTVTIKDNFHERLANFKVEFKTLLSDAFINKPNRKGGITEDDFKAVLIYFGEKYGDKAEFSPSEIANIIKNAEHIDKSIIDFKAFLGEEIVRENLEDDPDLMAEAERKAKEIFSKIKKGLEKANIKDVSFAFRTFDTNNDGSINVSEFKRGFSAMKINATEEDIEGIVAYIDKDGSGKIDLKEFTRALALGSK